MATTEMAYQNLGRSGLQISRLSFGSWVTFGTQVDDSLADRLMSLAYDAGINFFDNAEVYAKGESERLMGRTLKSKAWSRDTFILSSKAFWGGDAPTQNGLSRKHLFDACHAALKRLQTDYLDLYFCHRPDPKTPVAETVFAMNDLIRQGKVMYWGTSEWPASRIMEAQGVADQYGLIGPTVEQPQYNLFERAKVEQDYVPLYQKSGLGLTVWSPLASGILTGKYSGGVPQDSRMSLGNFGWLKEQKLESPQGRWQIQAVERIRPLAAQFGCTLAQLSIAWCLRNPNVSTVILGATKTSQLEDNLKALDVLQNFSPKLQEDINTALFGQIQQR